MSNKKILAIVHGGSYRGYPLGGIETFLATVIPQIRENFDLQLIGMSMGEPLGRWTEVEVDGKWHAFLPVLKHDRISWIPDRIQLMAGIAKYADEVSACRADAYYVHMTEAAISLLTITRRPIVVHVHGLYNLFKFSRHPLGRVYAQLYEKVYPQLFSRCTKVIGVGSATEFAEFVRTMKVRSGAAIPTCVRTDIFYPRSRRSSRQQLGLDTEEKIVLFVGRMTPTKNPRLLADAISKIRDRFPRIRAVFIGDGPERPVIEAAAEHDPRLVVLGRLNAAEIATWMRAADVLAVVSKTEAFTSIAALEALSCGTPVIATPVSALPEIIKEDANGVVARGLSVEAVADALTRVLMYPPDPASCAESVRDYSPNNVVAQIVAELEDAISPPNSREVVNTERELMAISRPITLS